MMKQLSKYLKYDLISLFAVVLTLLGLAVAQKPQAVQAATSDGKTQVVFWHEMGGPAEQALLKIVDGFNKSQDKYEVVPAYQGSYDEAVQKIIQTHGTNTSPAVFQSFDISTAQMMDSKYTTPIQKFADADNYDLNQISAGARAFYAKDGQQMAMPFNTSQPVLYYNATLLKKYHITPPPVSPSYSDISRVATQLYNRSNHKVKGMTVQIYGWLLEEALANARTSLTNNSDGHDGTPTKVNLNNPTTVQFLKWIRSNIQQGNFINYGSGASAGTNQIAGFLADKVGMFIQSSATIGQLTANNKNKLGITYFPHPDGTKANGVAIGGAALWISNDKPQNVQQGSFEFIKYALNAQNQAQWQKATGYLALNKDSQNETVLKKLYASNPEAKVPAQQLATATPNKTNSGILMQGMQLTRELEETAMETVYNGGDINNALTTANQSINDNLKLTNQANGVKPK
ncbi:family 1 extracellular solute-binding protein [Agrilactobacillus composti DSM 18527 = JCM 14202]|uniref:Family 1 extracellular solute-binding protein n=2 Tax=Agrilactobacillus TaxID=2767875 RepID=X0PRJ7_9LACO|nr:ABC transporter substrate-binding protein [Agrilactobacillus composti]KRM30806.1 family 1 extracellular solute-binding protein [Agrilactobacillus composti DSM 18527 = JCM 14202]GAF39801.1 glycerol-3-phosphate ABC transporter, periplasmic glycerol-3-phosphate-binding protein [Agrilactobacillus composti DSM 18527 = JCM 14202]